MEIQCIEGQRHCPPTRRLHQVGGVYFAERGVPSLLIQTDTLAVHNRGCLHCVVKSLCRTDVHVFEDVCICLRPSQSLRFLTNPLFAACLAQKKKLTGVCDVARDLQVDSWVRVRP